MIDAIRSKLAAAAPRSRLLVLLALIAVGATHCSPMSWNDESRMATIQSINNHELAAGFLAIGFFFVLRARFDGRAIDLLWAGLFLSLAGVCDIPTGVFYAIFFIYALAQKELRAKWLFYIIPLVFTALPTALANYSIHHSIMPVQIYSEYFQYPGSPWNGSPDLSGIQTNAVAFTLRYALLTLVGPMGFLIYNPLLLIAICIA